ncbi:hypothetical protein ACFX13_003197 [Malus domestica]
MNLHAKLGVNLRVLKLGSISQKFPILSKLDPAVYGPPESAITKELLEQEINGMSVDKYLCWRDLDAAAKAPQWALSSFISNLVLESMITN